MASDNYEAMDLDELQDVARERKLRGFSKLNKGPLIDFLRRYDQERGVPVDSDKPSGEDPADYSDLSGELEHAPEEVESSSVTVPVKVSVDFDPDPVPSAEIVSCPQCGVENPAAFTFCGACAARLDPDYKEPVPEPVPDPVHGYFRLTNDIRLLQAGTMYSLKAGKIISDRNHDIKAIKMAGGVLQHVDSPHG
jgi:hypothetical protein